MTVRALLTAACAGVASFALADIRAVTPVAWNGQPDCWQMARHAEKMKQVAAGGSKVVFIGDSITHYWEGAGQDVWNRYFADAPYRALNLGTSADRTEHVLWRITEGKELDGYEAKCILLMIGTNNTGHRSFADEPPVDTIQGVRRILDVIAEKQPTARTILTAIFPRDAEATSEKRRRNNIVNKELAKFADGKKVIWCDFTDKYLDAQGRLSRELFPDLLHPNAGGYEIWASAVIPLVDKVLAAQPDAVIPSVWPSAPAHYLQGGDVQDMPIACFPSAHYWKNRTLEKRNQIADSDGSFDIVMVGDSITHRWEREPDGEGRGLYAGLQKKYKILNLGYGGDGTQHVLWRLENGELEGYKAKLFTVMIGTNNQATREPMISNTARGIRHIVELIRKKHPEAKVVLMPIFPRNAKPDDKLRVGNEKINAQIKDVADGKDVLWLDFNAQFLTADGELTKDVMPDLLHPNAKGYQIWLDAISPLFEQICGK